MANPAEKATEGKHFQSLRSDLSKAKTEAVLSVLDGSPILDILARRPVSEISLARMEFRAGGVYDSKTIEVNTIRRWRRSYGEAFVPGKSSSLSRATTSATESMRRSLVHETAHHLQEIGGETVAKVATTAFSNPASRPISRYAMSGWGEYLAESWSAYNFEREALRTFDPTGL